MDRRDFTRALAGSALLGAAGLPALGAQAGAPPADAATPATPAPPDDWQAAFESRRAQAPWTLGYVGVEADAQPMPLALHGRLPAGLRGAFYRNGPARHQLGGQRYHHLFDGDGLVQKYEIGERGIVHRARFVRTEKFEADSAAGRPVSAGFGTNPPGAAPARSPDALNVANISVLSHGGEFLALWEGGSATRMDPQSLDTLGLKAWNREYAGMPFSAHPRLDPRDGTLWNFGISSSAGVLSVYQIARDGRLVRATSLPVPDLGMVHDFAITERHLVFLLPPLVFEPERMRAGETFLQSHVWRPGMPMRVMLLPKDRLDAPRWFELPTGFVFHLGNAWEDASGQTIRLDYIRSPDAWWATTGLYALMRGEYEPQELTRVALVELDLRTGRAHQRLLPHVAEFPRVDPRVVGRRYSQLLMAERAAPLPRPGYDSITRLDLATGRTDRYRYGPQVMVEEHIFVPRAPGTARPGDAAEGRGWVVGTALDLRTQSMLFSVFDAQRLADGPVAQGRMPRVMPLGLHGTFVPAA